MDSNTCISMSDRTQPLLAYAKTQERQLEWEMRTAQQQAEEKENNRKYAIEKEKE